MIRRLYFEWLLRLVDAKKGYTQLYKCLFETEFRYSIPMDDNRYQDGIELRYQFGKDCDISQNKIAKELDFMPCSVLEMMVALSQRIEHDIMQDDEFGNRCGDWFWVMITSMGLNGMNDPHFDQEEVEDTLVTMMDRLYDYEGHGGLFTVEHSYRDMRTTEIWYQAMEYLRAYI